MMKNYIGLDTVERYLTLHMGIEILRSLEVIRLSGLYKLARIITAFLRVRGNMLI